MTYSNHFFHKFLACFLAFSIFLTPAVPLFQIIPTYAADDGLPAVLQSFTSSTGDDSYWIGEVINITANFDESVDGSSTMAVTLDTGIQVNLTGDGDTSMSGIYTIGSWEASSDLTVASIDSASVTTVDDNPPVTETNYSIPGGQNLWDTAGLIIDGVIPTLSTATVNATSLVLTYNDNLDTGSTPATSDFVVNVNGSPVAKTNVSVSGTAVTLTLATTVGSGTTVTLSYTPGASPIQDGAWNNVWSLNGQSVTNNTLDITSPVLSTAIVEGITLTLTYNETLDSGSTPSTSDFVVNVGGSPVSISSVSINDVAVVLTLDASVGISTVVTMNYTVPGSFPTQDVAGNNAASLSGRSVTNNTGNTPPIFQSATVTNTTITLTYDETLDSGSIPATSDFVVSVNSSPVSKSSVNVSGTGVYITLSADVGFNSVVTLSYTAGWNPIQDEWWSHAGNLSGQSVTNNTPNGIFVGTNPLFSSIVGTKVYTNNAASSSNNISVIDTTTDTVIATIPVGLNPLFSSVTGTKLYVSNNASNTVSVIDTTTNAVIATIPVWTAPIHSSTIGTKVYVSNTGSNNVSVIDTTTDTVIATIPVWIYPDYSLTVGTKVYVNNYNGSSVSVIDTTTDTVIATIPVGSVVYSSSVVGTKIYVSNTGSHTVSVIDTITDTVIATIPVGTSPYPASVVGTTVYVINNVSNNVSVIDSITDTVIATIPVGSIPYGSSVIGTKIYVSNSAAGSISVIDTTTNTVIATIPVFTWISSSATATKVYVNNYGNSIISVIDAATDTLVSVFAPHLTSITSTTANGNYTTGQSVNIKAQFTEVLWAGSTMDVTLNTGDTVTLTRVSPGDTFLTGTYTVGSWDLATDLTVTNISNVSVSDTDLIPNTQTSFSVPYSPDLSTDTAQNLWDLKDISIWGGACTIAVWNNPYQMVTVGTLTYVANMGSDDISVINTSSNSVVGDSIDVGDRPYGLAYNSTTKEIYIANLGDNTVSVIDADPTHSGTTFKTVTHTINVGVEPYYVASLGTKIYVTNNLSNSVSVINTATHTVTATVWVGNAPRGIKAHGTDLYVSNFGSGAYGSNPSTIGTVSVIDSNTNTVSETIHVGIGPRGVVVVWDEVYVANFLDDTVSVIDTDTNTVTHTIAVWNTPRGITALGTTVYVENYQAGTVSVINTATHAVTDTVTVGNTPAGFATAGTDLYISRFTDDVVSILDTTTNTMRETCPVNDSTAPTFTMQIYSDSGLSTAITDNTILSTGTYYVSVTADETLGAAPTLSIAAQGTANDVTGATMTAVSGDQYKYTYVVTTDAASTGTVLADFSVTGTDSASNVATNVSPTNEATKAIYIDGILPTFSSANVNGPVLTLTYSEAMNSSSTPSTGSFTVLVGGVSRSVTEVTVTSTSVVLTLSSNVTAGQVVTVAYTVPGSSMLEDTAWNDAATLSATSVTNTTSGGGGGGGGWGGSTFVVDITAPVLTSLTANGSILKLVYNEILDSLSIPQTWAYTVRVNGLIRPITSVSIAGLEVRLLMSPGVLPEDVITMSYTAPSSQLWSNRPVQDAVSNDAISFIPQSVANITASIHVPDQEIPWSPISTDSGYGLIPVNSIKSSTFLYLSEDPTLLVRLQKIHRGETITESIYHNQCETKQGKTYYRTCLFDSDLPTFELFLQNVICEWFVSQKLSSIEYRLEDAALRKEVTGVAVKMKKVNGENIALAQPDEYRNSYSDIGKNPNEAKWIQPIVETALKYGIVSGTRKFFEPDRQVTRAEAYAMIMDSVCMLSHTTWSNWQKSLYDRAVWEKLTGRTWEKFEPNTPMLRQELFSLSSRVVEWAERTGWCDPKPEYCFVK